MLHFNEAYGHATRFNTTKTYESLVKAKGQFLYPKDSLLRYFQNVIKDVRIKQFVDSYSYGEFDEALMNDDFEKAKYYPEDKNFLVDFPEKVTHYEVFS